MRAMTRHQLALDAVMEHALRSPDGPAVVCGGSVLSYGALREAAEAAARELDADPRSAGADRIGILSHRTAGAVVYALAAWLSGRSFVFADPRAAPEALAHIRESAGLGVVVDPRTGAFDAAAEPPPVGASAGREWVRDPAEREAYVLYTSGSSGRPKGVSVSQRNLAASNAARVEVYERFGRPVFLLLSPFHFDSSVAGVWGTLAVGGTLVVADEEERRNPQALAGLIAAYGVTQTLTVPSFHSELLDTAREDAGVAAALERLRVVVCAGESLARSVIDRHFALLPGVVLGNEYGPTECTVWSTYRFYTEPADSTIGFAIPGATVHLLDERLRAVPLGAAGQIAVSGPTVARGYVGDEALTRARFTDVETGPGRLERVYLTGDLGRWLPEGGLEFVGRLDNEVKIRGVRVHIEAVEEAIAAHPGLRAAAVAYDAESATSYAFAVREPGAEVDAASVRRVVEEALSAAVVPDRIVFLPSLPRSAHDKIDRAALLASVRRPAPAAAAPAPVAGGLAAQIARAWEEVLGVPVRGTEQDTFFDLGGNSLSVLRLSRALGRIAGRTLPVRQVYRCGTIPEQVELLSQP